MKQEFKDIAKYRLERARDTLLDAQKYFKDATLNSTPSSLHTTFTALTRITKASHRDQ